MKDPLQQDHLQDRLVALFDQVYRLDERMITSKPGSAKPVSRFTWRSVAASTAATALVVCALPVLLTQFASGGASGRGPGDTATPTTASADAAELQLHDFYDKGATTATYGQGSLFLATNTADSCVVTRIPVAHRVVRARRVLPAAACVGMAYASGGALVLVAPPAAGAAPPKYQVIRLRSESLAVTATADLPPTVQQTISIGRSSVWLAAGNRVLSLDSSSLRRNGDVRIKGMTVTAVSPDAFGFWAVGDSSSGPLTNQVARIDAQGHLIFQRQLQGTVSAPTVVALPGNRALVGLQSSSRDARRVVINGTGDMAEIRADAARILLWNGNGGYAAGLNGLLEAIDNSGRTTATAITSGVINALTGVGRRAFVITPSRVAVTG